LDRAIARISTGFFLKNEPFGDNGGYNTRFPKSQAIQKSG